ncbi:MAG: hypothetical protein OMM_08244 [Candidatus Magnetoglobus multicellularis str. Araruama]|uniref:Uncharacterized protein n=1 Tax=Candidatus Magnetoglobus multicellularis str. Araruama TaxID=890399 RepID=A0A1V1P8S0_9BACT|nr:MAG: hypothetical protein OMM_08244 [Candidatus Magnetoglobus multicellularis str. Araruama]
MNYHIYIQSSQWRNKALFMKVLACIWRFSLLPLVFGDAHHIKYNNITKEIYLRDIVIIGPFVHSLVVHGILSGFKRPSQQKNYPNSLQSIVHFFYRLPFMGGLCMAGAANLIIQGVMK